MPLDIDIARVAIDIRSHRLIKELTGENPWLRDMIFTSPDPGAFRAALRERVTAVLDESPAAVKFYRSPRVNRAMFEAVEWRYYAAIRVLDYLDNTHRVVHDPNRGGEEFENDPFGMLYLGARHGRGGGTPAFFEDMLMLFRQLDGRLERVLPETSKVIEWMDRHPSGLEPRIREIRRRNRERIIETLVDWIDSGRVKSGRFTFDRIMTRAQKVRMVGEWWKDHRFHLSFAVRDPDMLNELLDHSLSPETMEVLHAARTKGIPFFVNPYYASLLNTTEPEGALGSDLAIRAYAIYSMQLVDAFGKISAWEKEDTVRPGEPNAAGWILPYDDSVHRRYPNVAILIPDTQGRACGGLCASCQRMYDFQRGHLNFDLDRLRPRESWPEKLERIMEYFENDTQLRDILITGGDALMSSDGALARVLDAIRRMAVRKREANQRRKDGDKYAELVRVRLGTRLPVYLPWRVNDGLVALLRDFKKAGAEAGIRQFVIQTHFESAMEVTPEVKDAVHRLLSAGWLVTNQLVLTAAASRRGHTAKLRRVLEDIGVLPYYTFTVKGFMENQANFATNARAVQEQIEEKAVGAVPAEYLEEIRAFHEDPATVAARTRHLLEKTGLPFLATDRNVLNLPAVGKSLTFRAVGITRDGRRLLEFDHDRTRSHSPIIEQMGKVLIVESKSIRGYLDQVVEMGEDPSEYETLWGYSMGAVEPRMPLYLYPGYGFQVTREMSNLELPEVDVAATASM